MSLDEAIQEYVRIKNRLNELYQENKDVLAILTPAAMEVRNGTKTSRLSNHDQSIVLRATWPQGYNCDVKTLGLVKEMLGDDRFEKLFRVEYKPNMLEMKKFLSEKSTDETIETAKVIIKEAVTVVPRPPSWEIEKG
jgi:hypothetical protein